MGNKATTSVASAAGLAMAKSQLKSFTSEFDSEPEKKNANEALSQATLKKLADQRKEREREYVVNVKHLFSIGC
jgi:hypothetical protein